MFFKFRKTHIRIVAAMLVAALSLALTAACAMNIPVIENARSSTAEPSGTKKPADNDGKSGDTMEIEPGMPPLTSPPAIPTVLTPTAPGTSVESNENGVIDYSNVSDGYVMIKWIGGDVDRGLRVQVIGPSATQYTYILNTDAEFEVFPLSDGNGEYTVRIVDMLEDGRGTVAISATISVTLVDEFAPFLRPNQYVDFDKDSKVVIKAAELVSSESSFIEKIAAIYNFVIKNISYDVDLANEIIAGMHPNYLPVIDDVLEKKKGICFDFAAVMTAMLRSQCIPTKLVVGYVNGDLRHAWIDVYSEEEGWIESIIYFDGKSWEMMDPTFASSGSSAAALREFIGDGSNYVEDKLY